MDLKKEINAYYDKELNFSHILRFEVEILKNKTQAKMIDDILFEFYLISKSIKLTKNRLIQH